MRPPVFSCLFLITTLVISSHTGFSQATSKKKKIKVYNAVVSVSTQKSRIVGILEKVSDSAVYLIVRKEGKEIPADIIKKIVIKRKGNAGRWALAGTLSGMVVGGAIGYAAGDDECDGSIFCISFSAEEKALISAILGSGVGALAGWVIGTIPKDVVVIGQSPAVFEKNTDLLRQYSWPGTD